MATSQVLKFRHFRENLKIFRIIVLMGNWQQVWIASLRVKNCRKSLFSSKFAFFNPIFRLKHDYNQKKISWFIYQWIIANILAILNSRCWLVNSTPKNWNNSPFQLFRWEKDMSASFHNETNPRSIKWVFKGVVRIKSS